MVGIVLVSHSILLATGLQQLIDQMVQGRVPLALAAGTENVDEPIGTDPMRVLQAIEAVYSTDGVLVFMDLGSAMMSAEAAIEFLPPEQQAQIYLCDAPLVEGALAAAVVAAGGASIERVLAEARQAQAAKLAQLAPALRTAPPTVPPASPDTPPAPSSLPNNDLVDLVQTFVIANHLGLHARPAARLVGIANRYDALITVGKGAHRADATSINQLLTLGVRQGDTVTIRAVGPAAASALAAIADLVATNFGDPPQVAEAAPPASTAFDGNPNLVQGIAASAGIAIGPVVLLTAAPPLVERRPVSDVVAEQTRFEAALSVVLRSLAMVEVQVAQRTAGLAHTATAEPATAILTAQRLMLFDPTLLDRVYQQLAAEQCNVEWVWQQVITALADQYAALDDAYLRRRALDVRDVGVWVLRALTGQPPVAQSITTSGILVADELAPSDAAVLDPALVLGIVTAQGGANDHSAILARSLGIPAVTGVTTALTQLHAGRQVALDGGAGRVWLDPDAATLATLTARRATWLATRTAAQHTAHLPAVTKDGVMIQVFANIGALDEVAGALAQGATGVGLLRTELLFMAQSTLLDEERQLQIYRQVATALGARPLVVRTLDIGGDKPLPQIAMAQEANPFLGWRGLRYCLDNPTLFRPQLRALLRLAAEQETPGRIKLMFPMVSTVEEVAAAKKLVTAESAQLVTEGYGVTQLPPMGIMIETPAAVFQAASLAQQVDFFSIGTNDLTQYIMAADRGNGHVASLVNAFQPAVIQALAQVAQAAQQAGIGVSVCGEMAADPRATALLIGLGIRELSMSASAIPTIKARIRQLDLAEATTVAHHVRRLTSVAAIETYLH